MVKFWIELNPAVDEYADTSLTFGTSRCVGLFASNGFCYIGVERSLAHRSDCPFWRYGLVIWNIGFGFWYDDEGV